MDLNFPRGEGTGKFPPVSGELVPTEDGGASGSSRGEKKRVLEGDRGEVLGRCCFNSVTMWS